MKKLKKHKYYLLALFIIGLTVFFPKFFNKFVWDDIFFIVFNPRIQELNPNILTNNIYVSNSIYRPVLAFYFSTLFSLFGTNTFPYHLVQVLLHITGAGFLYLFFTRFFMTKLAFVLSLLFLIHPINSEAVYWISSIQSQFLIVSGVSALLLAQKKEITKESFVFLGLALAFGIFSNETGFLFLLLVPLYRYLFQLSGIKKILIFEVILVFVYIIIRNAAGAFNYTYAGLDMAQLSLIERLQHIPIILQYYFSKLVFPLIIMIDQTWIIKSFTFSTFWLPLLVISALFVLYCFSWYILMKKQNFSLKSFIKRNKDFAVEYKSLCAFTFFSIWFFLCIGTIVQIFPLNLTVAERWFYLPFVGLMGMVGVYVSLFSTKIKTYERLLIVSLIILLSLLSIRTFVRGFDWRDEKTLFTREEQFQPENYFVLITLSDIYMHSRDFDRAIPRLENLTTKYMPNSANMFNELGTAYQETQQYDKAIETYTRAIWLMKNHKPINEPYYDNAAPYINLANTYLLSGRFDNVIMLLTDDVLSSYNVPEMYMLRASAYATIGNYEKAYVDAEYLMMISDEPKHKFFFERIKAQREQYGGTINQ